MATTARFDMTLLDDSQVEHAHGMNDNLLRLIHCGRATVLSAGTDAEPGSPSDGDCYVITGSATGTVWSTLSDGDIVCWLYGAWLVKSPQRGMIIRVLDDDPAAWRKYNTSWTDATL